MNQSDALVEYSNTKDSANIDQFEDSKNGRVESLMKIVFSLVKFNKMMYNYKYSCFKKGCASKISNLKL
jgi:hypothetical protein